MKLSLQNKLTLTLVALFLGALGFVGYIGYINTKEVYEKKIYESELVEVEDISRSIREKLEIMKQDANFIANFYAMQRLINWQSVGEESKIDLWEKASKDTFKSLIELKEFYYKLRTLDKDGEELISVYYDQDSRTPVIQSNRKLQDRSKETYFKEARELKMGEVLVSQMELNVEFGKLVHPYVPVVHFSSVIYDKNGDNRGVAVINAYADKILQAIDTHTKDHYNRMFINHKGYYLYHEDNAKEWGWQLGNDENFKKDYPEVFNVSSKNEEGSFEHKDTLYTYKRIYFDSQNHDKYWTIISEVDKSFIFAPLYQFQRLFFTLLLLTMAILIFILHRYIRGFMQPLNAVTKQLKSLAGGEIDLIDIKYNANDEIKDLIVSSQRVLQNIDNTIIQARTVASGDFTTRIKTASQNDSLANAINDMTNRLDATANLAIQLSKGDISVDLEVSNENDVLSSALSSLIHYFTQITAVTESIALGNFDVSFEVVGESDRLGQAVNEMIDRLKQVVVQANAIAGGDFEQRVIPMSQEDELAKALISMTETLRVNEKKNFQTNWLQDGLASLNQNLSGNKNVLEVFNTSLSLLARYTDGMSGAMFSYDKDTQELSLSATYAFNTRENFKNRYSIGEGLVGQVALERTMIHLQKSGEDSPIIDSALLQEHAVSTLVSPIEFEEELLGVMVIAYAVKLSAENILLLNEAVKVVGNYLFTASKNEQIKSLLEESQQSFEELQVKSEELQQSNVQMEEQRQQLEQQTAELKTQNEHAEKARQELDMQTKELERSSRYKSEFLANMSHELRTPLNSIILLSKLLKQENNKLNEEDRKKADVIHRSGNDLLLLINDILDLSKVESGHMEVMISSIDSNQVEQNLSSLFSEVAKEKGLKFIVDDQIKGMIMTDEQKLMQILKNLLSNAFKFTKDGEVVLEIAQSDREKYDYRFSIIDTGVGIDPQKQELVFGAFKQVDGSISRQYGGTGLGLSISKKFAELLGGAIELSSQLGEGSTFSLYLPDPESIKGDSSFIENELLENSKIDMAIEEQSITDTMYDLKDKQILIVDDDPRNIFTISSVFQEYGAQTMHALNGKDALIKIRENYENLDLVLMDIMMPEMDGYETMHHIRTDKEIANVPIIAVTAKAMKEERQKCLDAGADDYLTKPIDQEMLLKLSVSWIEKGAKD